MRPIACTPLRRISDPAFGRLGFSFNQLRPWSSHFVSRSWSLFQRNSTFNAIDPITEALLRTAAVAARWCPRSRLFLCWCRLMIPARVWRSRLDHLRNWCFSRICPFYLELQLIDPHAHSVLHLTSLKCAWISDFRRLIARCPGPANLIWS